MINPHLVKLRKQGELFLAKLICSNCHCQSENLYLNQSTSVLSCPNCNISPESSILVSTLPFKSFYQVFCFYHPNESAYYYHSFSFLPLCQSCSENFISVELSYPRLEEIFFELFNRNYQKLCSDRIRALISYDLKGLIEACRWLLELENGPCCIIHINEKATYLNRKLEGFCDGCRGSEDYLINDTKSAGNMVLDELKMKVKKVTGCFLNRYAISKGVIKNQMVVREGSEFNMLLLETKDLLAGKIFQKNRCVFCNRPIRVGQKQGVQLLCKHLVCFSCLISDYNQNCPIDYKIVSYEEYLDLKASYYECHTFHNLSQECEIIRLPCFHYSCVAHADLPNCFVCGFDLNKFPIKLRKKKFIANYNKFLNIKCIIHDKEIKNLQFMPLALCCDSCLENSKFSIKLHENSETFNLLFDLFFPMILNKKIQSQVVKFSEERILKIAAFLKIMPRHSKYLLISLLDIFLGLKQMDTHVGITFFHKIYPPLQSLHKELSLKTLSTFYITIKPKIDTTMTSILILKQYVIVTSNLMNAYINKMLIVQKEDISQQSGETFEFFPFIKSQNQAEKYTEFYLSRSLFISTMSYYDIIIEVHPGSYFYGSAYSRKRNNIIDLVEYGWIQDGVRSKSIEGPILGIGVYDSSTLVSS